MIEHAQNKKSFVTLLVLVLAAACFGAGVYMTMDAYASYKDADFKLKEETLKLKGKSDLEGIVKSNQANILRVESFFVNDNKLVNFLDEIKNTAGALGLQSELLSLSLDPKTGLMLDYQATGDFVDVYGLIKVVENLPYNIRVNQAMFQVGEEETEVGLARRKVWTASFLVELASFRGDLKNTTKKN